MTAQELLELCDSGKPVRLVSQDEKQPLSGYRGELLCVNPRTGEGVFLYSKRQVKRIARQLRAELADE